jgi:integrase
MGRRPHGTGSVYEQGASWYGRWYQNGKRVKRKIGPIRQPGSRDGLTENMVGKRLQRMMLEADAIEPVAERITVQEAGERLLAHLTALGRKPTTLNAYRAALKTHLSPVIGAITLENVTPTDIERFMAHDRQAGASAKTTLNALGFLHSVFEFAQRRGWCSRNPCKLVDKPRVEKTTDIRFLTEDELEALLRATTDPRDRVMYMIAAMTGLRQGELLALRWQDVDWPAARIRVRRNYVRGEWGTPKTRRGSRSVPLADRLAGELERHYQRSHYGADEDLVFCHAERGTVLDHSELVKRFKKALKAASVREVRFHDLRHTFGTRMAAAGVPLRTLQEWMGHRDFATTLIYADYQPSSREAEFIARAFGPGPNLGPNLSETERNSEHGNPANTG